MEAQKKEVYFDMYCGKCDFRDLDGFDNPCNECLTQPFNYDSHKPTKFVEKDAKKTDS